MIKIISTKKGTVFQSSNSNEKGDVLPLILDLSYVTPIMLNSSYISQAIIKIFIYVSFIALKVSYSAAFCTS